MLLVHTAYRAVRPVEGGIEGLIEALRQAIGPDGTLVMSSTSATDDEPFDPSSTPSDPSLGAVPAVFWRLPDVLRSDHPFAFAAIGPHAAEIVGGSLPLPPHIHASPVGKVYDLDGQVLLLGCNHGANTTIHLAELLANVPYGVPRYCTVRDENGRPVRINYVENDHCCERFALLDDWLRSGGLQSEGKVGHAEARLARSRDIVAATRDRLREHPLTFLHPPEAACEECAAARASVLSSASPYPA